MCRRWSKSHDILIEALPQPLPGPGGGALYGGHKQISLPFLEQDLQ